jgi:hypothetical protein
MCIFLKERFYKEKPQYLKYDKDYIDLNKLFELTAILPIRKNLLIKDVNYNTIEDHIDSTSNKSLINQHIERSMNTDLKIPVLVSMGDNGKWDLLDGWHRMYKARELGLNVKYKVVTKDILKLTFVTLEEIHNRGHKFP